MYIMEFGVKRFNKKEESFLRSKNVDYVINHAKAWGISPYVPGKIVKSTGKQKLKTKDALIKEIKKEIERRYAAAPYSSAARWNPSDLDVADISEETPYDLEDALTGMSLENELSLTGLTISSTPRLSSGVQSITITGTPNQLNTVMNGLNMFGVKIKPRQKLIKINQYSKLYGYSGVTSGKLGKKLRGTRERKVEPRIHFEKKTKKEAEHKTMGGKGVPNIKRREIAQQLLKEHSRRELLSEREHEISTLIAKWYYKYNQSDRDAITDDIVSRVLTIYKMSNLTSLQHFNKLETQYELQAIRMKDKEVGEKMLDSVNNTFKLLKPLITSIINRRTTSSAFARWRKP